MTASRPVKRRDPMTRGLLAAATAIALALAHAPATAQGWTGNAEDCADPNIAAERAERACSAALKSGGQPPGAVARLLANRGGARLDLGRPLAALDDFDRALAIEPTMFVAMTGRARALIGMGQWEAGVVQFDAALRQRPRDVNALMGRGAAYLSAGNAAAAKADFDRALQIDPEDLDARYNRGVAKLRLGDNNGAARDFGVVIQRDPSDAGAHLMRARTRIGTQDALALADYQRAVALSPEWAQAWYERGRQFDRMGRAEQANVDFRRAYELGFEDPWLQERIIEIGR